MTGRGKTPPLSPEGNELLGAEHAMCIHDAICDGNCVGRATTAVSSVSWGLDKEETTAAASPRRREMR